MRHYTLLITFLLSTAISAQSFIINPKLSNIEWIGYKVGGSHRGIIQFKSCDLKIENNQIHEAAISIDMTSIEITDIESQSGKEKLMEIFHSKPFFNVSEYPIAQFKLSEQINYNSEKPTLKGSLTIKNITKEFSFPIEQVNADGKLIINGSLKINRHDFNIKYGEGFFSSLGDKAIKDIFHINFSLVFEKS